MIDNKWVASAGVAAASTVWAAALLAGPWAGHVSIAASGVLYAVGALVCHQLPERSFHAGGVQLPVCARCLGLYLGAAAGALAWTVVASTRLTPWSRAAALRTLAVLGAPTGITVVSAWLGTGDPSNLWRAGLALPLGVGAGLIVGAASTGHLK